MRQRLKELWISIHALLAESDVTVLGIQHRVGISIHALLAESDIISPHSTPDNGNFYPRSPCGERLDVNNPILAVTSISIHALLAESDVSVIQAIQGRLIFLSTLSLRRATFFMAQNLKA